MICSVSASIEGLKSVSGSNLGSLGASETIGKGGGRWGGKVRDMDSGKESSPVGTFGRLSSLMEPPSGSSNMLCSAAELNSLVIGGLP